MAFYTTLTTLRTTTPDTIALAAAVKAATGDPTAVLVSSGDGTWRGKKNAADWSPADLAVAQAALETTPVVTDRQLAQRTVDAWPIEYRALVLALVDQLNVVRAALLTPLGPITPAQALAAIRAKAGTL